MHRSIPFLAVAGLAAALAVPAASASSADRPVPTLTGRAVLPAVTLASGPPSGAAITDANGVDFPLPSQPVIGFSALLDGRRAGEYLAMPDNGYGGKANSRDFLIRAYFVTPDFTTAKGGSGDVAVDADFIQFSDPGRLIGFPIVHEATVERPLTGGDIDPESLQRDKDGSFWMGDEFGPWILHFSSDGVLLEPPYALPGGLMSPNNPFLMGPATQPNSRGLEAMAMSPSGHHLYPILEGPSVAAAGTTARTVLEFSTVDKAFTGRTWTYHTQLAPNMVADAAALDQHRIALIERDGGSGLTALFRQVRVIDLRRADADGNLDSSLAIDLAAIADPDLVSLPGNPGDVGLGDPFRVTCESVEALHPLDQTRYLIGCDNNLPNKGRNLVRADDTELIVVSTPGLRGGV